MKLALLSTLLLALSLPSMALADTAPSASLAPGWRIAAPTVELSDNEATPIAMRRYWGGRVYVDPPYRSYYYRPYYYRSYPSDYYYYYRPYWGPRYRVWW